MFRRTRNKFKKPIVDEVSEYLTSNESPSDCGAFVVKTLRDRAEKSAGYYMLDLSPLRIVLQEYFESLSDLKTILDKYDEFVKGYESVVHDDARVLYGDQYDSGRNVSANTFLYGNLKRVEDVFLPILRDKIHNRPDIDLSLALQILRIHNCGVWSSYQIHLEQNLVKTIAPAIKSQADVISFSSALSTYKALAVFSIALGQTPNFVFEAASEHHKSDLAKARKQKEDLERSTASAI